MDTLSVIQPDWSIKVKIYRKSTNTDQHLDFNSNHPVEHKLVVIRTLYHRADTVVTDNLDRQEEKSHVNSALAKCGYPKWALDRAVKPKQKKAPPADSKPASKGSVAIHYVKGFSEALKRTYNTYGVNAYFKPTHSLRKFLSPPKTKLIRKTLLGQFMGFFAKAKPLRQMQGILHWWKRTLSKDSLSWT